MKEVRNFRFCSARRRPRVGMGKHLDRASKTDFPVERPRGEPGVCASWGEDDAVATCRVDRSRRAAPADCRQGILGGGQQSPQAQWAGFFPPPPRERFTISPSAASPGGEVVASTSSEEIRGDVAASAKVCPLARGHRGQGLNRTLPLAPPSRGMRDSRIAVVGMVTFLSCCTASQNAVRFTAASCRWHRSADRFF